MTRILAITNQKGGVGKTTSVINIASYWARKIGPDRVLVVDIDPQASATSIFLGLAKAVGPRQRSSLTIKGVLEQTATVSEAIQSAPLSESAPYAASTVHVLPAHPELGLIETVLNQYADGLFRLVEAMDSLNGRYEVIIIDCPPSLGIFTTTALLTCQEVIIPVIPGKFEMVGLALLQKTLEMVQKPRLNPALRISGILPTKTTHTRISRDTIAELTERFGNLVLPSVPERVAIHEAHAANSDIFAYSPDNDGAEAYARVVEALIARRL